MTTLSSQPTALIEQASAVLGTKIVVTKRSKAIWAHFEVVTTATAGNRNIVFSMYKGDGTKIYDIRAGANQGASLTRHYNHLPGVTRETSFGGNGTELVIPVPLAVMERGWYITVADENAVDAADTFSGFIQVEQ